MNTKMNDKIDINEHRRHLNKLDLEIEKTLQDLQNLNELNKSPQQPRASPTPHREMVSQATEITPNKFTPLDPNKRGVNLRTGSPGDSFHQLSARGVPHRSPLPNPKDIVSQHPQGLEYHHSSPYLQSKMKTTASQPNLPRVDELQADGFDSIPEKKFALSSKKTSAAQVRYENIEERSATPPHSARNRVVERITPAQQVMRGDSAAIRKPKENPFVDKNPKPKVVLPRGNEPRVEDRLLEYGRIRKERLQELENERIFRAKEIASRRPHTSKERYPVNEPSERKDSPPALPLRQESPTKKILDSARRAVRFAEALPLEEIKNRQTDPDHIFTKTTLSTQEDRLFTMPNLTHEERTKIMQEQKELLDFLMKSHRRSPPRIDSEEIYAMAATSGRSGTRSLTPPKSDREATFHPNISENSRRIAAKMGDAQKRIVNSTTGKIKDRTKVIQTNKKDLTFRPEINETSKRLDEHFKAVQFQGDQLHRWDQLYLMKDKYNIELQMRRLEKERCEMEQDAHSFQPKLNHLNNDIVRHAGVDFADRAKRWQEHREQRLNKERDAQTAREMEDCTFKPRVKAANITENGQVFIRGLDQHFERVDMMTKRKKEVEIKTSKFTGKSWRNQITVPQEFNFTLTGPKGTSHSPAPNRYSKSRSRSPIQTTDRSQKKSPRDISPRLLSTYDTNEGPKYYPQTKNIEQYNHLHQYLHNLQL